LFLGLVGLITLAVLWNQAEVQAARDRAAQDRELARASGELAEAARKRALQQKKLTEAARDRARQQKKLAAEANRRAARERQLAAVERKRVKEVKDLLGRAERGERLALESAEKTRRALFNVQLVLAGAVVEKDPVYARELLEDGERCPKAWRDFTWGQLRW